MFRKKSTTATLTTALVAALVMLALPRTAMTAEKKSPAKTKEDVAAQPAEGEVDISDVQSQYWKAHDKQFEVIQNKLYTKAERFELSAMFGLYQRVDFQDAKTLGGSLAY
ncbi:MAG TPA: hypothetical protein PLH57_10290, partial [Oligoflexia bacterium]|nr:hypothetical protein [Oligoflexia bacterium]